MIILADLISNKATLASPMDTIESVMSFKLGRSSVQLDSNNLIDFDKTEST